VQSCSQLPFGHSVSPLVLGGTVGGVTLPDVPEDPEDPEEPDEPDDPEDPPGAGVDETVQARASVPSEAISAIFLKNIRHLLRAAWSG
jgi:hypothetical protein